MKRAPIVLTGTAAGLVAVIGYHAAAPQASTLTASSSTSSGASTLNIGSAATTHAATTSTRTTTSAARTTTSAARTTTSAASETTRSAVGSDIQYQYGELEVKVTMTGSKITDVSVVSLNVTDPRLESIDQYALPELRSEALQAQSASIDGVSGASYTSAAYEQSLQSAIDRLKA